MRASSKRAFRTCLTELPFLCSVVKSVVTAGRIFGGNAVRISEASPCSLNALFAVGTSGFSDFVHSPVL
jgi:hypothetical protein